MSESVSISVPAVLPLFPLREIVAFPYMIFPLFLKDDELTAFEDMLGHEQMVVLARTREEAVPGQTPQLCEIGTLCKVNQIYRLPEGGGKVVLEGVVRVRILDVADTLPHIQVRCEVVHEFFEKSVVSEALVQSLNALLKIALSYGRPLPDDVMKMIDLIDNPARLADLVALYVNLPLDEQQRLLETVDPLERLKKVYMHLTAEVQRLQVKGEVQAEVTRRVGKSQKEYLLREQMKQIQEELGEEDPRGTEMTELRSRIQNAGMPDEVRKIADKELKRLDRINPSSPEYTVARTYLDYLAGMPWGRSTADNHDINQAEAVLDEDHYDLKKVKERILEYLAVRTLRERMKGPILCFVGPPGVGKTSLGKSIARALGRKFIRMSLGGMRDEAEIRGHRRTYIGALPGRIIQEIFRCGSNNPVFMLDEVDKIGLDFRGDPASALLEVLDPEQNSTFTDHYLDVPFDLSNVMFITTANLLDPVPAALKDRMEVIRLSGYTDEEKEKIAVRYLIPKEVEENGLSATPPAFASAAIYKIIGDYTREAGVRNLQRSIASVCRKVAKEITQGKPLRETITPEVVEEFLGPRTFFNEVAAEQDRVGVVTGLAWTETGGDILFVEATRMKGKRDLILTGSLGDVMKESARTALSYVRATCADWGIDEGAFEDSDLHIHVPAGAIPKDGPSAGLTMVTAIVSLLSGRPARRDVAMTGEISLTGRALAIGGLKEKVLAARRAGVKTVVAPSRNRENLEDIPDDVKNELTFIFVDDVHEAVAAALQ
ncbi:endopeptidase La [Geobacter sulfurreducens]|uniref:Lon protease n=1 Tax=Geobacter sulfurreducens (strain ATCC 51573 / DSM 12127 / PCA) TaxID=243231 RepID=Q74EN9_GEOSL|nr:endopeptidase La [Geobacter sulfurreducens]AAR34250.2 ATP-dependent Lon protease (La) [Geobacter sulfurreducens PCA]UAC04981.1 endopeptidase La [Geobacter sulfurreducens]HCD96734.1 endopeptidase La [Geobacter sulfurreducens]